jgi:hypothetical protein
MKCKYCGEEGIRKNLDVTGRIVDYFCPYCLDTLEIDEVVITLEDKLRDYILELWERRNNPYVPEAYKDALGIVISDLNKVLA